MRPPALLPALLRACRGCLLLALLLLCPPGLGADEPAAPGALLRRALQGAPDEREAARAALGALEPAALHAEALAALGSGDRALEAAGAALVHPTLLDREGLARLSAVLARAPGARLSPPEDLRELAEDTFAQGSADLPALWGALAAGTVETDFSGLHRVLRHAEVPRLAPLLAQGSDLVFQALLWDLVNQAVGTLGATHEAVYVEALRYALARLDARDAGAPPPPWGRLPAPAPRAGLPAAFLQLAEAAWGPGEGGFQRARAPQMGEGEASGPTVPSTWLCRWARRLEPGPEDLPFLLRLVQWARAPAAVRFRAAAHLAQGAGREGGRLLQEALAVPGPGAVFTAAAAARLGHPEAWQRFVREASGEERLWLERLRWQVEPTAAEDAALAELRRGGLPLALEEGERWGAALEFGLEVPEASLERLAAQVRAGDLPPMVDLAFFARALPAAFTRADAERIVAGWSALDAPAPSLEQELLGDLALLEVRHPEGVRALLRRWAARTDGDVEPAELHELLARLGDASALPALLGTWPTWDQPEVLGRVRDPRVEEFLRERAASPDVEVESAAVQALAVLGGLPEPLSGYLSSASRPEEDPSAEGWADAKALVLAGDPLAAVLRRTRAGELLSVSPEEWFAGFGLTRDARATEALRVWARPGASGLLWPATAALALQGDGPARATWTGFLAEARTFLLDDLQEPTLFTLDGDRTLLAAWAERLDENCCYAWHAAEVLDRALPTLRAEHAPGDGGRARHVAQRWLALHGPHLVRTALLDAWVPGPR